MAEAHLYIFNVQPKDLKPEVQLLISTSTGILLETNWIGHPDPLLLGTQPGDKMPCWIFLHCTFQKQRDIMEIIDAVDAVLPKGWEW